MKTERKDFILSAAFCAFLAVMLALFLLLPKQEFSEKEKRYLTKMPELTWEKVSSGAYGEELEAYLADHVPGRDFLVGLSAYYDLFSNRQVAAQVYVAEGDRLVEPPVLWEEAAAVKNMASVNKFAEIAGSPVDLMIVPSAGFVLEDTILGLHNPYRDDEIIQNIYAMAGETVDCVDLIGPLAESPERKALYYRTDHHWTSLGAYTAYGAYMEALERDYPRREEFQIEQIQNFQGSTYSRSALWLTPGEPLELWHAGAELTVTNGEDETPHEGVFYRQRLEELDKYTVYLDGNHSIVRIENPEAAGQGRLLVIRDSYANCLGAFLANSYESVTLVDLRYYKKPVSELLEQEDYTNILLCYSIGNFLTDANIIWLR